MAIKIELWSVSHSILGLFRRFLQKQGLGGEMTAACPFCSAPTSSQLLYPQVGEAYVTFESKGLRMIEASDSPIEPQMMSMTGSDSCKR